MRLSILFLLSAMFVGGAVYAQPTQSTPTTGGGTTALSPNNCGTPDEPKPCYGTKMGSSHYTPAHKAAAHTTTPPKSQ